jgi:hypothetical protein
VGVYYWFALGAVQSLIIPSGPGGRFGPWVVRPSPYVHFIAVMCMAMATFMLVTWLREGERMRARGDGTLFRLLLSTTLLSAGLLLWHLSVWEFIGPDGIEQRLPWTMEKHSYQDISSLELRPEFPLPHGIYLTTDRLSYSITFKDGSSMTLTNNSEDITSEEWRAMIDFIAKRSGLVWKRPEEEVERAIRKLGGWVSRDDKAEGKPIVGVSFALMPQNMKVVDADLKVLRELTNLKELCLGETQVTDEGLKKLKELKNLKELKLLGTKVTDEGLKELKELKNLRTLSLTGTQVTDKGLKELKELKNLTELWLGGTQVTDEWLKQLGELTNLTLLWLGETQVTDEGLKELKELKKLQTLSLTGTQVTDKGLKELKELKHLKWLSLDDTKVTDEGLKELRELTNLQTLDLRHTLVTDEGLKELKKLKNLTTLYAADTWGVTDEGLKELKEALPKCHIDMYQPRPPASEK